MDSDKGQYYSKVKESWTTHYSSAPATLKAMQDVSGVISAFNAGTDAVKKVKPEDLKRWIESSGATDEVIKPGPAGAVNTVSDVIRGIIDCFKVGKGEEWIIKSD